MTDTHMHMPIWPFIWLCGDGIALTEDRLIDLFAQVQKTPA